MDIKDHLDQIAQTLFTEAEGMHTKGDDNSSRVMFAAMMAAGASALLGDDGEYLKTILKDINEIIDQINVAIIKNHDGTDLH